MNSFWKIIPMAVFLALASSVSARAAEDGCGSIPAVSWWNVTHQDVTRHVDAAHGGYWTSYIAQWEDYRARISEAGERSRAINIQNARIELEGTRLETYIGAVDRLISVVRCLGGDMETATSLTAAGEKAAGQCAAFPRVPWWNNLTHDKVKRYVVLKHDGDWTSYLDKWERQLDKVKDIHARNSTLVVIKRGVRLEGAELDDYIGKVAKRVAISHCLAGKAFRSAALETPARDG